MFENSLLEVTLLWALDNYPLITMGVVTIAFLIFSLIIIYLNDKEIYFNILREGDRLLKGEKNRPYNYGFIIFCFLVSTFFLGVYFIIELSHFLAA